MQFNDIIIFLLPLKNYLAILNLILTSILDTGINYLFIVGTCFSRDSNIFLQVLINLYNILFSCYWKRKNELISCLANFIPVIISFVLIIIMTCSAEGEIFTRIIINILLIIFVITIIFLVIPEDITLKIVGISIIITSISKILIPVNNINSFLKREEYYSYDLKITILGFICYSGWLSFGLIIGDLYCIISNGIISLIWMISILVNCWFRYYKKKNDREDKNKDVQMKSSETELKDKE